MNYTNAYLNNLLKQQQQTLKSQKQELKALPQGTLHIHKEPSRLQYIHLIPASQSPTGAPARKGITKNEALIRKLARKRYLEKSIRLLAEETSQLEAFLKNHTEPSHENIMKLLPKSFSHIPEDYFFPGRTKAHSWADMPYPQNTLYVEDKIHTTSRGLKVRSKSELVIAEKLDQFDIPYRYDALLQAGHIILSPDFSFMTTEGPMYWEHCGMMDDPQYRWRSKQRLAKYERIGIVPWKNLIITYDTEDGALNMTFIESEIKNRLLPLI